MKNHTKSMICVWIRSSDAVRVIRAAEQREAQERIGSDWDALKRALQRWRTVILLWVTAR